MNSQTTELPELPKPYSFIGFSDPQRATEDVFSADQMRDYARAALEHAQRVTQPAVLSDERILRLWDTHVAYETNPNRPKQPPLESKDKLAFARAILAAATPSAGEAAMPLTDEKILYFARHAADRIPESNYEGRVIHAVRMALDAAKVSAGEAEPRMVFCPACFVEVSAKEADQQTLDARRYRWLRDQWDRGTLEAVMLSKSSDGTAWVGGEVLDGRIDAAMASGSAG